MDQQVNQASYQLYKIIFWYGLIKIGRYIQKYFYAKNKIKQLQQQLIQTKNENDLKKLIGLGMHCKFASELKTKRKVGSLQRLFNIYPIQKNAKRFNSLKVKKALWVSKQFNQRLYFPQISHQNVFQIKHQYTPKNHSLLSSIICVSGTILAFVVDALVRIITLDYDTSSFYIRGPTVGVLETTFNLVTDQPLILQCHIEGGRILPKVMGLTKQDIIDFYNSEKGNNLQKGLIWIFILYLMRKDIKKCYLKPLWRKIKGCLKYLKLWKPEDIKILNTDAQDQLLCIICMHRCRSVIFENCKHFAICNQCRQDYRTQSIDKCPICRKEINEEYIFVQPYEQIPY